jgi:DNA-binding transcriptional ArsR family regulator
MNAKEATKILKALSNENRYELFMKIKEGGQAEFEAGCGCLLHDLISTLNIGAPTVSHHIKELVNAGLVITEKRGKYLLCKVNQAAIAELEEIFKK